MCQRIFKGLVAFFFLFLERSSFRFRSTFNERSTFNPQHVGSTPLTRLEPDLSPSYLSPVVDYMVTVHGPRE
jgi:hypothetical protein